MGYGEYIAEQKPCAPSLCCGLYQLHLRCRHLQCFMIFMGKKMSPLC